MIGIKRVENVKKMSRANLLCPMCHSRLCDISEKSEIHVLKEFSQKEYIQIRCHKCGSVYAVTTK